MDRRADQPLRELVDELFHEVEVARQEHADLRRRGRSLKRGFVGLSLWLTALSLWGYAELRSALERIQANRQEILQANCEHHDAFITGYHGTIRLRLEPAALLAAARRDGLTIDAERSRIEQGQAITDALIEAFQPRNPKKPNDQRPCRVIARELG